MKSLVLHWLAASLALSAGPEDRAAPAPEVAPPVAPAYCSSRGELSRPIDWRPSVPPPVDAPEYYAFPVVSTRRVPGTGLAEGTGWVTFAPSPFGVALADDGSYLLDVWLATERLAKQRDGVYVAWITTTDLDVVEYVGAVGDDGQVQGTARWNKFLLVVTLEPADDPDADLWSGPVVMRGMSRSGQMHTMAGHGAFEQENCAAYGYG